MRKKKYVIWLVVVLTVGVALLVRQSWSSPKVLTVQGALTLGAIEPLTGSTAFYGEQSKRGTDLAAQLINEELHDFVVKVVHEDSQYTGKGGIDAYKQLKASNNLDAVLTFASPVSLALGPELGVDGLLQVAVSTSAKSYSSLQDLSVRVSAVTDGEAAPAVDYIKRHGFTRVALLHMKNEIGESMASSLRAELVRQGLPPVVEDSFPVETADFRALLTKVFLNKPDVVYVAGIGPHLANILLQSYELKLQTQFMGFRTAEDYTLQKMAGDLANGLVYTYAFDPTSSDPAVLKFVKAYQAQYGENPDGYAAEGYEGLLVAVRALRQCGKDTACLQNVFQSWGEVDSVFGKLSFDEYGDVSYPFFLKTVKDGKFVRLEEGE